MEWVGRDGAAEGRQNAQDDLNAAVQRVFAGAAWSARAPAFVGLRMKNHTDSSVWARPTHAERLLEEGGAASPPLPSSCGGGGRRPYAPVPALQTRDGCKQSACAPACPVAAPPAPDTSFHRVDFADQSHTPCKTPAQPKRYFCRWIRWAPMKWPAAGGAVAAARAPRRRLGAAAPTAGSTAGGASRGISWVAAWGGYHISWATGPMPQPRRRSRRRRRGGRTGPVAVGVSPSSLVLGSVAPRSRRSSRRPTRPRVGPPGHRTGAPPSTAPLTAWPVM